ncbi:MAG: exodeoxyribonuclease VII small subunit [Hyphomonas sp.]|uniref:exodeoxyribonuclease VII small subunit n=1 Tax=Hyphomonas sp. TaxID=87 RepID=UPI0017D36C03|nr:exodeoxyribonuclease VII small subunit [Hyphomonas sp.]MBA3069745.1 exodeoxyribonuclease VII small subunit [Hyphomonas sp.]MBU4062586.1 exodeoxyribonuclease VII small subunit [Alphaproteobacteria bacterium]MBU4163937.1 exodeoxyribonuclease VII small subunit [Alphaproteobacteria bacterium]
MAEAKTKPVDKMTFEEALAELEVIVRQLEAGDVELEKSIAIYERGAALKAHCETRLKSAELKVEQIVQGANGPATEPAAFD